MMNTIWFNTTSSHNWHRPAVGIIRVEIEIIKHLKEIFPDNVKECIWNGSMFVPKDFNFVYKSKFFSIKEFESNEYKKYYKKLLEKLLIKFENNIVRKKMRDRLVKLKKLASEPYVDVHNIFPGRNITQRLKRYAVSITQKIIKIQQLLSKSSAINLQGSPYISGWSQEESWGCWNDGTKASLNVPIPRTDKTLEIDFTIQPFVNEKHRRQHVEVYADGTKIATWIFYYQGKQPKTTLHFSPYFLAGKSTLQLVFIFKDAISPKDLGISCDSRQLAIGLIRQNACENTLMQAGDIFVSVGIDWDQNFGDTFYYLRKRGIHTIGFCHDVIPVLFPHFCIQTTREKFPAFLIELSEGCEHIVCNSENTKKDLAKYLYAVGARIPPMSVIALGDKTYEKCPRCQLSNALQEVMVKNYILYVSTIEGRKNHRVLQQAYHLLREQGHELPLLVFVGMAAWGVTDLMDEIQNDPLTKEYIVLLNNVTDEELPYLYENAMFCVFPSFYEGWGLSIGEALSFGKVVLASNAGSIPEIGGDLVEYASPYNAEEWAKKLLRLINDQIFLQQREKRISEYYTPRTWRNTAIQFASILKEYIY